MIIQNRYFLTNLDIVFILVLMLGKNQLFCFENVKEDKLYER